jgi:hypothetical protein
MELWKDIIGFEGIYQVSNLGNVKRLNREISMIMKGSNCTKKITEKILTPDINWSGYARIALNRNKFSVHRLVASAFVVNPENKKYVNHKNGIKNDNRLENLEWVTNSENLIHAYKTGLKHKDNIWKNRERKNVKLSKIVLDFSTGIYFDSITEAAIYRGFKKSTLTNMLNGSRFNNTLLKVV